MAHSHNSLKGPYVFSQCCISVSHLLRPSLNGIYTRKVENTPLRHSFTGLENTSASREHHVVWDLGGRVHERYAGSCWYALDEEEPDKKCCSSSSEKSALVAVLEVQSMTKKRLLQASQRAECEEKNTGRQAFQILREGNVLRTKVGTDILNLLSCNLGKHGPCNR